MGGFEPLVSDWWHCGLSLPVGNLALLAGMHPPLRITVAEQQGLTLFLGYGGTQRVQQGSKPWTCPPDGCLMLCGEAFAWESTLLSSVVLSLSPDRLLETAMAMAGVNPHAGEGGLFGREEIEQIAPAVQQARAEGLDVSGPHAPDTVFMRARTDEFDVVIAMYHDQGLIPVKYLGLEHGVNSTLGLPFVRTSPDHGTAFDLAGTGRADPSSLLAAVRAAIGA